MYEINTCQWKDFPSVVLYSDRNLIPLPTHVLNLSYTTVLNWALSTILSSEESNWDLYLLCSWNFCQIWQIYKQTSVLCSCKFLCSSSSWKLNFRSVRHSKDPENLLIIVEILLFFSKKCNSGCTKAQFYLKSSCWQRDYARFIWSNFQRQIHFKLKLHC